MRVNSRFLGVFPALAVLLSSPHVMAGDAPPVAASTAIQNPADQDAPKPQDPEEPEAEPGAARRALAVGASVVPGALVHGSGSWVLGDDEAATRLLLLEGAGIGLTLGGLAGLALTGASRYLTGPLAVTTIAGVSLFSLTLLADIYRVSAPAEGFGVPRHTPFFESHAGYVYVQDPLFQYRHFAHHGFRVQVEATSLRFEMFSAVDQANTRLRVHPAFRLWQPEKNRAGVVTDGSFFDTSFAGTYHDFHRDGFSTMTYELLQELRLDTTRIVPTLRGAFTEFNLGYALRQSRFRDFGVTSYDTLLLAGFGFGVYLGEAEGQGGEAVLYYDHRHDDFAAGLKASGLGSGVPGHMGLKAHYYFDQHWGLGGFAEVGSAWVLGLGLRVRGGSF